MASIYKRGESPYYYAAYFRADGSRAYRSTGCRSKREANEKAVEWEKAETKASRAHAELQPEIAAIVAKAGREASTGQLTLDKARKHVMEIYRLSSNEEFPSYSVEVWLKLWLKEHDKRVSFATMQRYTNSVNAVLKSLGTARNKDMALLTTEDVSSVQSKLGKVGTKASTTNFKVQDFKNAIRTAFERGIIDRDVGASVKALPTTDSDLRAEFSASEIQKLIAKATEEWKGAILIAALTGLRLSNIAGLAWNEVDLEHTELVLTPVKQRTGKEEVITIPMADAVYRHFVKIKPDGKTPTGPVFPGLTTRPPATLSTHFRRLMEVADVPREVELPGSRMAVRSFHSLRHFYVSSLANANIPEDVRKTLAAHKSGEVHRIYTHHDKSTLRSAIDSLPEL